MIIPNNAKQMILFTLAGRGIAPVHATPEVIVFLVQFASGLLLTAAIKAKSQKGLFRNKVVITLGVLKEADAGHAEEYDIDAPTSPHDIAWGVKCASRLLAMVRATADLNDGGYCLTPGWLGQERA